MENEIQLEELIESLKTVQQIRHEEAVFIEFVPEIKEKSNKLQEVVKRTMKEMAIQKKKDATKVIKNSKQYKTDAMIEKYHADKLSRKKAEEIRRMQMAILSAHMSMAGAKFMEAARQTAIGGAKTAGAIAAGLEQIGKTFIAYGKHTLNMASRSFEDAPKAMAKMQDTLTKELNKTLSIASNFLEKTQKYFERNKAQKESTKQIEILTKTVVGLNEKFERLEIVDKLREEGEIDHANNVKNTETPSEKQAREEKAAKESAEAKKIADNLKKEQEKLAKSSIEHKKEYDLLMKRALEDAKINDSVGNFSDKKKQYSDMLRGKTAVVKALKDSSPASDTNKVDKTNTPSVIEKANTREI